MAQDYIMRLLQQVAAMLAAIIAKRRGGDLAAAKQEIETACLQTAGLPLATVKRLAPDALAEHLLAGGANRYLRAVMLAELLMQDAELHEAEGGMQQALGSYLHAFCLLSDSFAVLSAEERSTYRPKLAVLAAKLEHLPKNPYATEKLCAYRNSESA